MKRNPIEKIELRNFTIRSASGHEILTDVNFNFPMNSIIWVKGTSGSGKSVLGKVLSGLVMPTSGEYLVNDLVVGEMSFEEFLPYRCNMGYSFDFGGLINNRDILSNLLLPIQYHKYDFGHPDEFIELVHNYLKIFGLEKVAYERPSAVVGRLRKAACVARAFIHNPCMIILDDPTTGLRPDVCENLAQLILKKTDSNELRHVFIVTEDEKFMKHFDAKVITIDHHRLHAHASEVAA